jgi:subtilisin family serine protease
MDGLLPVARIALLLVFALPALAGDARAATPSPVRADVADETPADVAEEIVVARAGGLTRTERARAGVAPGRPLPLDGVEVVAAPGDRAAALRALRADPDVEWAEPNRPRHIAAEPLGGLLWGLGNTGQSVWWQRGTPDADIDAPEAWSLGRGAGVTVAIVDTGADATHPELAGKLVPGWDFVDDDADPQDGNGHGTHVAATVAAAQNGAGIVGVAPAARIMPLRVLDENGQGSSADVAAAFAFAAARGVRVVNASLGSEHESQAERRAIEEHPGTLFVVASGNGGADSAGDDVDGAAPEYPCAHAAPNVVCVGATDQADALARFSNYGATSVDLFAPGTAIVSAVPFARASQLHQHFGTGPGYEVMQGTSMASPHAAGVAAIEAGLQPGWGAAALKDALLAGADRLPELAGRSVTGARLNAAGAAALAAGRPPGTPDRSALPRGNELAPSPTAPAPSPPAQAAGRPQVRALRLSGHPRVCRGATGCHARTATLSFRLSTAAEVAVALERRRCGERRCRWHRAGTRTRAARAGRTTWTVGPRLLGMRLRPGRWHVAVSAGGGVARRTFRVGGR